MSKFESGFCEPSEYSFYKEKRAMADELIIDEKYLMMIALKKGFGYDRAAKFPARIVGVEERDSGLHNVRFAILHPDPNGPDLETEALFNDGFWAKPPRCVTVAGKGIHNGYFKPHWDADQDLQQLESGLLAPSPPNPVEEQVVA